MTVVAPFFLRLLGPPSLADADGQPVRLRTKKQLALVARLAWESPRGLSRDYLVDFLWSSAEPRAARHSLAQALTALRKVVGDGALTCAGATVALRAGVVGLDVRAPERLDGALLGRLFEGFHIPDVPAFEQWRDRIAAETWPVLREAIVRAISQARSIGRYGEVEALGRELLARDSLCEAGIEACVQGRALAGDRVGALRIYDGYRERLRKEVGTQPSDSLQRAAANLRRGVAPRETRSLRVAEATTGQRSAFKPVPLVGRERSYLKIHEFWTTARQGQPQYVLIIGTQGVGKTALGMMLAAAAHAEGSAVVRLQLHETERTAPYALLAEVIRQLLIYPGAGATPGEALAELSRICPWVRAQFPGVAEAPPAMPETVHLRLSEALVELLSSVTEEQPVLLLVDDIVLGDDASLVVLRRLPRKLGDHRVFVCYTSSTEDLSSVLVDPDSRTDGEMGRWARIALGPLGDADARLLVRRRLADGPWDGQGEVERRVLKLGRGNPLALEMLLLDWRSYGSDSLVFRADAVVGGELAPSRIPDRIRQAFERQRAMLSESGREILDLAAVLGHRLLDLDIYAALGASPMRVTEASRQLLAAGLWSDAGVELEFRNELLRIHAYVSIPRPARAALHARVVRVLEERIEPGNASQLLELAWHLWRAGDRRRAADRALEGSERCLETFAPRTAERVATDFLAESIGDVERSRFRYVLGRALTMQSRLRAAEGPLRLAMEDGNLTRSERAEARLSLADVLLRGSDGAAISSAVVLAESALRVAETTRDLRQLGRGHRLLAQALVDCGKEVELPNQLATLRMLQARESGEDPHLELAVAFINAQLGEQAGALRHLRRSITLLELKGDIEDLAFAYNGLGVSLFRLGDWTGAKAAFTEASERFKKLESTEGMARMLSHIGAVELMTGEYDEAMSFLSQASDAMQPEEDARYQIEVLTNIALCSLGLGDLDLAQRTIASLANRARMTSFWEIRVASALATADYHLSCGAHSSAWPLIEQASDLAHTREHRIIDLDRYLRLRAVQLAHRDGVRIARTWLDGLPTRILGERVSSALLFRVLKAWFDTCEGRASLTSLHDAMAETANAGALGLLHELAWSGISVDSANRWQRDAQA